MHTRREKSEKASTPVVNLQTRLSSSDFQTEVLISRPRTLYADMVGDMIKICGKTMPQTISVIRNCNITITIGILEGM